MNVPQNHQMNIARKTLKMTPAGARVMGGMDYETAYEFVFHTPLRPRLESLVSQYGNTGPYSWELQRFGWDNAADLLAAI